LFNESVKTAAERILHSVPAGGEISSWEVKVKLHLSSSMLHLALGYLLHQGSIELIPDQLNYRILPVARQNPDAS